MADTKRYVEIAIGHQSNRGIVIAVPQLDTYVKDAQATRQPLYRSVFSFDEEVCEYARVKRSIRGYTGTFYADSLIFDIDKGVNTPQLTLSRFRAFIERLNNELLIPYEDMQAYFSGTGYHLEIPDLFGFKPGNNLPQTVRATLVRIFPELDKAIYTVSAIIRVANTINHKAQLYKIPLKMDEVFRLEASNIADLAKGPRNDFELTPIVSPSIEEAPLARYQTMPLPPVREVEKQHKREESDKVAVQIVTCMQNAYNDGPQEGSRHETLMRLISSLRRQGVPRHAIIVLMKDWAQGVEPLEIERYVNNIFDSAYQYGCDDAIMRKFCDSRCVFFRKKNYAVETANPHAMESTLRDFVRSDWSQVVLNMHEIYEIDKPHVWYPGNLILVYGDSEVGKTAWVQSLALAAPHLRWIYGSLEFGPRLFYQRCVQIKHSLTEAQVYEHYRHNDNTLSAGMENIEAIFLPPSLDEIRKLIATKTPQVFVVDTTDMIDVPGREGLEKEEIIARSLKEIAQQQDIIVVGIHHLSKDAAKMHTTSQGKFVKPPLTMHSGKGASSFYQKADKVIGMESEGKGFPVVVRTLKSRDSAHFNMRLNFDGEHLKFTQITNNPQETR